MYASYCAFFCCKCVFQRIRAQTREVNSKNATVKTRFVLFCVIAYSIVYAPVNPFIETVCFPRSSRSASAMVLCSPRAHWCNISRLLQTSQIAVAVYGRVRFARGAKSNYIISRILKRTEPTRKTSSRRVLSTPNLLPD